MLQYLSKYLTWFLLLYISSALSVFFLYWITAPAFCERVPEPIEIVLGRLKELEERCRILEEQCLNLQQELDTVRGNKEEKRISQEPPIDLLALTEEPTSTENVSSKKKLSDVTQYLKKGEIQRALSLLDHFIHHKQFKPQALYYKGLILMHQKSYAQADAFFSEAYLALKTTPMISAQHPIHKDRQRLFPLQILLKSAECLYALGKHHEAQFVCEEIKRNLSKIPPQYHRKILQRIQKITPSTQKKRNT